MSKTVLYMSVSLDGFTAGPNESKDHGLGDGGLRLHEWIKHPHGPTGTNKTVWDAFMSTGAVVGGRRLYEMTGGWANDHHDGVPLFWVVRDPSTYEDRAAPNVTFLDDVTEAMTRAKEAAGDRDVLVHGVGVTRLALAARVLDELRISVVPVLFGTGQPLFDALGPHHTELERLGTVDGEDGIVHLHYRVIGARSLSPTATPGSER